MPNQYTHESTAERFWAKVDASGECWEWQGAPNDGYGILRVNGHNLKAHRLSWEMAVGPIPDGMMVLHTCDNRACVRNDDEGWYEVNGVLHPRRGHLWLGTNEDNVTDREAKGRGNQPLGDRHGLRAHPERAPRGERNRNAKLSPCDIEIIRQRYADERTPQIVLAEEFGVTQSQISSIVTGRTWRHL